MKKIFITLILLLPILLFGQSTMKTDTLYKVDRLNFGGNTGSTGALLIFGDSVRINVLGSQVIPDSTNKMVNLYTLILPARDSVRIDTLGAYSFQILPKYIFLDGAADRVEIVGYKSENLGVIP